MKNKSIPAWRLELALNGLLQAREMLPPGEELDEVERMLDESYEIVKSVRDGTAYPKRMTRCIPITEPIKRKRGRPRKVSAPAPEFQVPAEDRTHQDQ